MKPVDTLHTFSQINNYAHEFCTVTLIFVCMYFLFSSLKHHERDEKVRIDTALEQENQKGMHDFLFLFFCAEICCILKKVQNALIT